MIDAAVMGGVANYEKAFLHNDYINSHPEEHTQIEALKRLISEMVPLLEYGLVVHESRVSNQIIALHDHMLTEFHKMKDLLTSKYGKAVAPDLGILRKSLRPLRQVSMDTSVSERSSHYGEAASPHQSFQRLSFGSAYNTLPRNKLPSTGGSSSSKPKKDKKDKFRSLLRRDSQTSRESHSLFYDQTAIAPTSQQPIIEISESLTNERPLRSEALRSSRPNSLVSSNTAQSSSICSSPATPTPSTSGSIESLSASLCSRG